MGACSVGAFGLRGCAAFRSHRDVSLRHTAGRQSATTVQLQQRYDIAYAQCMSASGNSVQPFAALWPYGPYGYPYPYPGFYGAWFGSAVALDTLSGFPHRFHRHQPAGHGS